MSDLYPVWMAVPGADSEALEAELTSAALVGWTIDGDVLGYPGIGIGLVMGDDRAAWTTGDDGPIDFDELRRRLDARWSGSSVGNTMAPTGIEPTGPTSSAPHLPFAAIAVTEPADQMLGIVAALTKAPFHEVRFGRHVLLGHGPLPEHHDDFMTEGLANIKGVTVALWRRGAYTGLGVLKKSKLRSLHWWAPAWRPVGGPDFDEPRGIFLPPVGDAAEMGRVVGLAADEVVQLRALLRRPQPDLVELTGLLRLPPVVVDVIEGRATVADLPGSIAHEPGSTASAVKDVMTPKFLRRRRDR